MHSAKESLSKGLATLVNLATLVLATAAVVKLLAAPSTPLPGLPAIEEPAWPRLVELSTPLSDNAGPPDVILAFDFECAACRHHLLHTIPKLTNGQEGAASVWLLHSPLRSHSRAFGLAVAAECAAEQGRLRQFATTLAESFDGGANVDSIATAAGINDLASYRACQDSRGTATSRITASVALGDSLNVAYTPTVFVRGKRFTRPASADEILAAVRTR